jgi:membrane protein CcdC involved in cytochrome C biogenesis
LHPPAPSLRALAESSILSTENGNFWIAAFAMVMIQRVMLYNYVSG